MRDAELAGLIASYKRDVAGTYVSVRPDAIAATIPTGNHIASAKIDGEQWLLYKDSDGTVLLSPNGKAITGAHVHVIEEADRILTGWTGILAGELYATVDTGRPRVFDLHSAMGGGVSAGVERLRFAVFDILRDGSIDCQQLPFDDRAKRIGELLIGSDIIHSVDFTEVAGSDGVDRFFESKIRDGEEGVVVRCCDGRIFKVKPRIAIDATVIAYTEISAGVGELLLALMPEQQDDQQMMQIIGRVDTGFSQAERRELAERLESLKCESAINLSSRSGLPYQWVRPEMVVEIACHELLTVNSDGEPIRRWRVSYDSSGWKPLGKATSVSLRDAVFVRVREDKSAVLPDIRWSQVTDLVPIENTSHAADLPKSKIIRREVYTKRVRDYGVAVRKLVIWKTNKDDIDPRYSMYAAMFTDYSPARQEPIRTELRVAAGVERMMATAENWLAENIRRGWECVARSGDVAASQCKNNVSVRVGAGSHTFVISFARSTSPTFPIVRRRLDALAELGQVNITTDDVGKEVWLELCVRGGLVENYRRITNLLSLVRRWKSTEIALDGDTLDKYTTDDVLSRIEEIRQCWNRRKATGPAGCRRDCSLGCRALRITPSQRFLDGAFVTEPQWYTVGKFEAGRVIIGKSGLVSQVDRRRNKLLDCCPCFSRDAVLSAMQTLPDVLSPDEPGYQIVCKRDDGLAAWVWPEHASGDPLLSSFDVEFKRAYHFVRPWETSLDSPATQAIVTAFGRFADQEPLIAGAPFSCDLGVYGEVGHMLSILLGPRGGNLHAPDEWVQVEDILTLIGVFAELVRSWCGC